MFPQVSSVFFNWTNAVQMRVVRKVAVDFEMEPDTLGVDTFEAVVQAMKSRDVDRKPEGLREWKWWTMWSVVRLPADTVVQDMNGVEFRVQSVEDWSQGGFYKTDMTEQPRGLP